MKKKSIDTAKYSDESKIKSSEGQFTSTVASQCHSSIIQV